jgi:hypothetical protein
MKHGYLLRMRMYKIFEIQNTIQLRYVNNLLKKNYIHDVEYL